VIGEPLRLNRRSFARPLIASAALAAALTLGGCDTDGVVPGARSMQPLSAAMISKIEKKNMSKESPILVRLFKEEAELEVWKQDRDGNFALLKTYPICRWSGELGPKLKEGDRQAPEGFYTITPSLMNPNSSYYLAINMGFPNAYDKANGRTGNFLMIHGDCSSRGCYAMTDEQIAEIYALARESFFGGQRAFQIQAYPFRMTALNLAKHRNSPHMAFWRMLKQGYDHFEVTRREPKVNVCERHYVFDADANNAKFSPAGKCPAYTVPEEIVAAVKQKQERDDAQVAALVRQNTPTVATRTGTDGGMNPVFYTALKSYNLDSDGVVLAPVTTSIGTIPANIRPPREPSHPATHETATASNTSTRHSSTKVATAQSPSSWFGGLFSFGGKSSSSAAPEAATASIPTPKRKPATASKPVQTASTTVRTKTPPASQHASTPPSSPAPGAIRPQHTQEASAAPLAKPASSASLMSGAQPTVPSGSFNSRWGAFSQ
jgi:murein L,D-transpeptidase YafK